MFASLNTRAKFFATLTLFGVVVALCVGLWFSASIAANRIRVAAAQAIQTEANSTDIEQVRKFSYEHRDAMDAVETSVLTNSKTLSFIESVEQLAREVGVDGEIETVTSATYPGAPSSYEALRLAIHASGSWTNVYHFLSLLENLPYRSELLQATIEQQVVKVGDHDKVSSKIWTGDFSLQVLRSKKQ